MITSNKAAEDEKDEEAGLPVSSNSRQRFVVNEEPVSFEGEMLKDRELKILNIAKQTTQKKTIKYSGE